MRKKVLYKIPHILLYSRLVTAILIIGVAFIKVPPLAVILLSVYAIISDILDGIIARYLRISTIEMRQLDTKIDTVFWFSCLFYLCINHSSFLKTHFLQIFILVFSELFIIVVGKLKFNDRISYHTILSKCWALCLLWFFVDIILNNNGSISFTISFWYGIIVQIEILMIAFMLKTNQTDVPSIIHALKIKKGLSIRKNRFFNG
ncbi:MAG: CDP-alcohol phosphatidyltransferase family protein [Bacteroidetes bacterium]|nr:CDP-alcohol phosphatidyltransferase family protein [Bacteroidota bacterium]